MENLKCPECGSSDYRKDGWNDGEQHYKCKVCKRRFKKSSKPSWNRLNNIEKKEVKMENPNLGISIESFKEKNDPKTIIEKGLSKLTPDKLYKTEDFKLLIGLPPNFGSKKLLELGMLDNYHGKCRGEVYWSHPETIKSLKFEAILT